MSLPHVALLIETSREYARGLLRGVARYHQQFGPWSIYFEPHGLADPPPPWLAGWKGDGILAHINDRRMADAIRKTNLPAVDLRGALPDLGLPFIGVDNRPVAQLAFDHLQNCGLKHFAFCGTPRGENPNQDFRCDCFFQLASRAGFRCDICLGTKKQRGGVNWEREQQFIAKWLRELPKPVGVMTCHDDRGQQVLDACRRAGLQVPDEVAVISVDNDTYLCNLCTPPLTSIDVHPSHVGWEGAALLDRMMRGARPPSKPLLIGPPRGIAARRSTDMLFIEDVEVAATIRYIRENATTGIRVRDALTRSRLSASMLERRFKKALGRTIKAEITRVRLSRARLLLTETNLPVAKIAQQVGYDEPKYFCEVFRKSEEMTATQFRDQFRAES